MVNVGKCIIYFQYKADLDYPVYLRFDPQKFDPNLLQVIDEIGFTKCDEKDVETAEKRVVIGKAKFLDISEASPKVAYQIGDAKFEDRFGPESITPKSGYKIYRYVGIGLLIYSFATNEWELGCFPRFGGKASEVAARVIINRFLSWALCSFGVIGFWGVLADEGIVVMKQSRSLGESVFIDIGRRMILSSGENHKIGSSLEIIRLDRTLKGRTIGMSKEELFSFLSNRTTFFDYNGLIVSVRQMIQAISRISSGVIHPHDDFRPKVDLSY